MDDPTHEGYCLCGTCEQERAETQRLRKLEIKQAARYRRAAQQRDHREAVRIAIARDERLP